MTAASIHGPFTKIDEDTVEGHTGGYGGESYGGYSSYKPTPKLPKQKAQLPLPSHDYILNRDTGKWESTSQLKPLQEKAQQYFDKQRQLNNPDVDSELENITNELLSEPGYPSFMERASDAQLDALFNLETKEDGCKPIKIRLSGGLEVECDDKKYVIGRDGSMTREIARIKVEKPESKQTEPYHSSAGNKVTIKLLPTFRDTLKELENRGISTSIISLNTPGSVKDILKAFGLLDKFIQVQDSYENKGKVFYKITADHRINPCTAMFVDDNISNVEDVSREGGLAVVIGKDADVEKPADILNFIGGSHGCQINK
jgi:predicted phosphatase